MVYLTQWRRRRIIGRRVALGTRITPLPIQTTTINDPEIPQTQVVSEKSLPTWPVNIDADSEPQLRL